MTAQAGDAIVVESERVDQPVRRGVIEEVLQEEPHGFESAGMMAIRAFSPHPPERQQSRSGRRREGRTPISDEAAVLFGHSDPRVIRPTA